MDEQYLVAIFFRVVWTELKEHRLDVPHNACGR